MERRELLAAAGAGATLGFAGCLGGDSGDGTPDSNSSENGNTNGNETPEDNSSENGDANGNADDEPGNGDDTPQIGSDRYEDAVDTLVTVDQSLRALAEPAVDRTPGQVKALRTQLSEAKSALDDAATAGIETGDAEAVHAFQSQLAECHAEGAEAFDQVEAALDVETGSGVESLGGLDLEPYVNGAETLAAANDRVATQRTLRDGLDSARAQAAAAELDGADLSYDDPLSAFLRYTEAELDGVETLNGTFRLLFVAYENVVRGARAFDETDWSGAESRFRTAQGPVSDATAQLDDLSAADVERVVQNYPVLSLDDIGVVLDTVDGTVTSLIDAAETAQAGDVDEAQATFDTASGQIGALLGV